MRRPSNDEVMSKDPKVLELAADLARGRLKPNVRPDAVQARYSKSWEAKEKPSLSCPTPVASPPRK